MKVKLLKKTEFLLLREYINKNKITSISPGSYSQSNCYHVDFFVEDVFFAQAKLSKNVFNSGDFFILLFKNNDLRILDEYQVCETNEDIIYITLLGSSSWV
jgi:hypothetical protein